MKICSKNLNILLIPIIIFLFCLTIGCNTVNEVSGRKGPLPPEWWHNPKQDDEEFMFVKANSSYCSSEQQARDKAYTNALGLISKRILSNVSVNGSDVKISSHYALRNTRVNGEKTEYYRGKWYAWVLVSYPQEEKNKLLDRIEKSERNKQDIQNRVKNISNNFKVTLRTVNGKTDFEQGEKVDFVLTSSEDCYAAVFCHQSDGSTVLLFPNSWSGNTRVYANRQVRIPGTNKSGFEIIVGPPYGTDIVQVIACSEYSLLHKQLQEIAGEQYGYSGISRGLFSKSINDSISDFKNNRTVPAWGEASLTISTYPK